MHDDQPMNESSVTQPVDVPRHGLDQYRMEIKPGLRDDVDEKLPRIKVLVVQGRGEASFTYHPARRALARPAMPSTAYTPSHLPRFAEGSSDDAHHFNQISGQTVCQHDRSRIVLLPSTY